MGDGCDCCCNILWFIFGGFEIGLIWCIAGCFLCISIIGIPMGMECFKIGCFAMCPFGKDITPSQDQGSCWNCVCNCIWIILCGLIICIMEGICGIKDSEGYGDDGTICPICMDKKKSTICLPCKHFFCEICIEKLLEKASCPICRGEIKIIFDINLKSERIIKPMINIDIGDNSSFSFGSDRHSFDLQRLDFESIEDEEDEHDE